eukprot:1570057-Amphidinium_carterae.1
MRALDRTEYESGIVFSAKLLRTLVELTLRLKVCTHTPLSLAHSMYGVLPGASSSLLVTTSVR